MECKKQSFELANRPSLTRTARDNPTHPPSLRGWCRGYFRKESSMHLQDKGVLVTGGASGLGEACVRIIDTSWGESGYC